MKIRFTTLVFIIYFSVTKSFALDGQNFPWLFWVKEKHSWFRAVKFHDEYWRWDETKKWVLVFPNIIRPFFENNYKETNITRSDFINDSKLILRLFQRDDLNVFEKTFYNEVSNEIFSLSKSKFNKIIKNGKRNLTSPCWNESNRVYITNKSVKFLFDLFKNIPKSKFDNSIEGNTMFIPLSVAWFYNDDYRRTFFNYVWVQSGWDYRIGPGTSGEGVVKDTDDVSFAQMKFLLEQTYRWLGNKYAQKSLEDKWILENLNSEKLDRATRYIFVHADTWNKLCNRNKVENFAAYILVNQKVAQIQNDIFTTFLAHELIVNTNSKYFFSRDTHFLYEKAQELLDSNTLSIHQDDIAQILAIQPTLSMLSIASFLY